MPPVGPVSRRRLIRGLSQLGFTGPFSGGKHQYMVRDQLRLRIPNPHAGDISIGLLMRILREAGITRQQWEKI